MEKAEIIEGLDQMIESLKNFNTFKHLFSEDEGERKLAELLRLCVQVKTAVNLTDVKSVELSGNVFDHETTPTVGSLVGIKPVGDQKTYLGILLGEVATSVGYRVEGDKLMLKRSQYNPAIFVPDLKRVVFGFESWWGEIESEDQLRQITKDDIENVWYVKMFRALKREENVTEEQTNTNEAGREGGVPG